MTEQTKRECIKALAYGKTVTEVSSVMGIPLDEVKAIEEKDILTERAYLMSMGYMG